MSRMMELTSFPLLILISFSLRYPCIISRIAAFCGESLFLLAIIKTSKLSNIILHQFEGLHKLWDTPYSSGLSMANAFNAQSDPGVVFKSFSASQQSMRSI